MKGRGSIFHDMRSSLNGVICMGSLLEETELTEEQADLLKYMLLSAEKTLTLIDDFQKRAVNNRPCDEKIIDPGKSDNSENPSDQEHRNTQPEDGGKTFSILVAEDDYVSRLYLTTLLRRQNWHIDEAADGMEALELYEKNSYHLILMDVSMPGVDGIQAAQNIRSRDRDIPIIAITAHGESELEKDFIEAGMSDVLRKPIHDEYLLNKIKSLCTG